MKINVWTSAVWRWNIIVFAPCLPPSQHSSIPHNNVHVHYWKKLIKPTAGAPPEQTPGRLQQRQQTLLPFQITLFTFQGRTRCSLSCLGFWAFKHKGTRIKYLSRLYVCLSKKFFRRQTEHQKSLSAAEGNVRERSRQAYAARYRVCFLCVFVPFIRWKLASDLSTYVILLSGRRGFPRSHMLHHIAHGEHVTVHRVCCFLCRNPSSLKLGVKQLYSFHVNPQQISLRSPHVAPLSLQLHLLSDNKYRSVFCKSSSSPPTSPGATLVCDGENDPPANVWVI